MAERAEEQGWASSAKPLPGKAGTGERAPPGGSELITEQKEEPQACTPARAPLPPRQRQNGSTPRLVPHKWKKCYQERPVLWGPGCRGGQRGDCCQVLVHIGESHAGASGQWLLICSQDLDASVRATEPLPVPAVRWEPVTTAPSPYLPASLPTGCGSALGFHPQFCPL